MSAPQFTNILQYSTAMKLTSLSKSVRSIGLMALLSVVVGSLVQQSVQAQNQAQLKAPVTCNLQLKNGFFYEFQDIKFTPKQEATYRKISATMKQKADAQVKNVRTEPRPDASVDVVFKEGITDKIALEISEASTAMGSRNLPPKEQMRLLTEKYGQYATFFQTPTLRFTPQQIAAKEKMNRDFEAQMMSIFTPQQRKVYRANLVIKRQIEACDTDKSDG